MNVTLVPITPHRWLSQVNLFARYSTVFASVIWALVVFYYGDAFTVTNNFLRAVMAEDMWGLLMLGAASYVFWQTKQENPQNWLTMFCNALMTFLWIYTVIGLIVFWKQVPPGGFAACVTVALLSCMNTLAIPKRE